MMSRHRTNDIAPSAKLALVFDEPHFVHLAQRLNGQEPVILLVELTRIERATS